MKTIRRLTTLAGLSLVLLALATVGAKGQVLDSTHFTGRFTLPSQAQWGQITLPAGEYTMQYGVQNNGPGLVFVRGMAKGSPQGVILAGPIADSSTKKNSLVCIRDGDTLLVRALEMPMIGQAIRFGLPRGTKLMARNGKYNGYTQLAEAPLLIQRIAVTPNAK